MPAGALRFEIKVSGLADVTYALHVLPARVKEQVRKALLVTSRLVVQKAKALVPVDTGKLESGIKAQWSPTNNLVRQVVADLGGDPARHIAAPVEYGRKKYGRKDAQPFLRPALMAIRLDMFTQTQEAVDAAVRSLGGLAGIRSLTDLSFNPSSSLAGSVGHFGGLDSHSGRGVGTRTISGGGGGLTRRKKKSHKLGFATDES